MHTQLISTIPANLFKNAKDEIYSVDWDKVMDSDSRTKLSTAFANNSIALHLRIHDYSPGDPHTRQFLSEIIKCRNTTFSAEYPAVDSLVKWVCDTQNISEIGRIMVVKMLPRTDILPHVDSGSYFQHYSRFHIPIITNSDVFFCGPKGSNPTHMIAGNLYKLDNRNEHSVSNKSDKFRIHIIADLADGS